jgi:hypothetical protein
MLELALTAGVMVACLGGALEFGYTFYVYNQLLSAVGNGARYAALRPHTADPEADQAAIRNLVVFGTAKPAPAAVALVPNLKPEHVEVEFVPGAGRVRVGIRNFVVDAVFARFAFDGRPVVEFPYLGQPEVAP